MQKAIKLTHVDDDDVAHLFANQPEYCRNIRVVSAPRVKRAQFKEFPSSNFVSKHKNKINI